MTFVSPFVGITDTGTTEDDVLIGGLGNDTLLGGEGDDVLIGTFGENILNGEGGDDVIIDGLGDDLMLGSAGNDTLRSSAGDDTMDAGAGDDLYFVGGALPGGSVLISDIGGNDTLDALRSSTSAIIDLQPGQISYVDGRSVRIEGGIETSERPLDLVLLQDLSGSFSDDLTQMRALVGDLVSRISEVASDVHLGAASFVDKPISPFGDSGDYEYQTDLGLTNDFTAFTDVVNNWDTLFGSDGPESQLTGLLQIAVRAEEIGWRSTSVRVVVLTTDAEFHVAGDNASSGPNNGDDVLDGTPPGSGEDYPTVEQVRNALISMNIIPIFAVTSFETSGYEALVEQLGIGAVIPLDGDSANIIEVFEDAIDISTTSLVENARGGDFDDTIRGNTLDNLLSGRDGDDALSGRDGDDTLAGGEGDDTLSGGEGNDRLFGNDGGDRLFGNNGDDSLSGGNDDDYLSGGNDNDTLRGGNGDDTLLGGNGADTMDGGAGEDGLSGGSGDDTLSGGSGDDRLFGNDDNDQMSGGSGDDSLSGGNGDDTLEGGTGQDTLTGGNGADVFVFSDVSHSVHGSDRDTITDFTAGTDVIDLSGFSGTLSFVASFTNTAGEVRYNDTVGRLYIDIDGDSASDFSVDLGAGAGLTAGDLIL